MVALVFWIACTRSGRTCCHLSLLRGLQNPWAISWSNENEIMNGNQGDHATFVWTWRRSKQRLSFCRTVHPFIQRPMPIPCTDVHSGAPMSLGLHMWVGMGCQALNFRSQANYVFKMSRMHACLKMYNPLYNTFKSQALWKTSQVWVSSAARQERPSMLFNFAKVILVNIWILNWVPCSFYIFGDV